MSNRYSLKCLVKKRIISLIIAVGLLGLAVYVDNAGADDISVKVVENGIPDAVEALRKQQASE